MKSSNTYGSHTIQLFFYICFIPKGGRDGLKTLNTVECYDPRTDEWTTLPPMLTHRHGVGVAVMGGPMYAVGGHDGWSYLNTVERFVNLWLPD